MEFRRPQDVDFEQILTLQNRNLFWTLSEIERSHGFLMTAFTVEQFQVIDRSVCVFVCIDQGQVQGYICAGAPHLYEPHVRPAAMLKAWSATVLDGQRASMDRVFVVNPICIDQAYRGTGVYQGLVEHVLQCARTDYDWAICFMSIENHRHFKVIQTVGMRVINQFKVENHIFYLMARDLRKPSYK